jgi:hypothetical protein
MALDTITDYGIESHMNARKLFYHKETRGDVILEMVIWELPEYSKDRPHRLKYRFYCGTAESCVSTV